jgi:hypothetical protein
MSARTDPSCWPRRTISVRCPASARSTGPRISGTAGSAASATAAANSAPGAAPGSWCPAAVSAWTPGRCPRPHGRARAPAARPPTRGAGNNGPVSTAEVSSFLNMWRSAGAEGVAGVAGWLAGLGGRGGSAQDLAVQGSVSPPVANQKARTPCALTPNAAHNPRGPPHAGLTASYERPDERTASQPGECASEQAHPETAFARATPMSSGVQSRPIAGQ